MSNFRYFLIGTATGISDKGAWYRLTINVTETTEDGTNDYACAIYTDAVIYAKCQTMPKFQEIDCIFVPNAKGTAKIVSLEQL